MVSEINYYTSLCEKYPKQFLKNVGWNSIESQELRFSVLKNCKIRNNESILDIGCGYGNLFSWLIRNEYHVNYSGIDIIPKFVNYCKKNIQSTECIFTECNFINYHKPHDWVFASGVFCLKHKDWEQYITKSLKHLYHISVKGVVVNFLTNPKKVNPDMHYTTNKVLDNIISPWCDNYQIDNTYKTNDISVILLK